MSFSRYKNPGAGAFLQVDGTINPNSTAVVETIPVDSGASGLNGGAILSDISSTGTLQFGAFGGYADSILLSAAGVDTTTKAHIYLDSADTASFGWNKSYHNAGEGLVTIEVDGSNGVRSQEFYSADNALVATKPSNVDKFPVMIGAKNAQAKIGVTNSVALGGDWSGVNDIDKDDTAFAQELRFNSSLNTNTITDVNSTAIIQYLGASNAVVVDTDSGSLEKGWVYMDDTYGGFGHNSTGANATDGGAFNADVGSAGVNVRYIKSGGTDVDLLRSQNNTAGNITSTSVDTYGLLLGANAGVINQNVTNAVVLGGVGVTADKDDTAFAQELRFNSSLNKTVISDTNSNATIDFETTNNGVYISSDGLGSSGGNLIGVDDTQYYFSQTDFSTSDGAWISGTTTKNSMAYWDNTNKRSSFFDIRNLLGFNEFLLQLNDSCERGWVIYSASNVGADRGASNVDCLPVAISTNNGILKSNVLNSVILGGTQVDADTDNTAHVANLNRKIQTISSTSGAIDISDSKLNLTCTTIAWQSGTTVRYSFSGSPDLSGITTSDRLKVSTATECSNNGTFTITTVNDTSDYIEVTNAARTNATDDESSLSISTDVIDTPISDGAYMVLTLTEDTTINLATLYSTNNSCKFTIKVIQAAASSFTVTLGTNILTPGGVAPAMSTSNNAEDTFRFETNQDGKVELESHRKAYA